MKKFFITLILLAALGGAGCYYAYTQGWLPANKICKKAKVKKVDPIYAEKGQAVPIAFPNAADAKAQAKEQGKPCLVLWYGSQFLGPKREKQLQIVWNNVAKAGLPVVLGQLDEEAPENEKANTRQLFNMESYQLPTAVLLDAEGRFIARFSTLSCYNSKKLAEEVNRILALLPAFNAKADAARAAKGPEAAKAAGEALDMLSFTQARDNWNLLDIIRKQDPEDSTGYKSIYGMGFLDIYAEVNKRLQGGSDGKKKGKDREFDAADAYVDKVLANAKLKGEQRQQWMAAKAYILRERLNSQPGSYEEKDYAPLVKLYKDIVALDPNSQVGTGAAVYARYWDKNAYYEFTDGTYTGSQCTRHRKEWHVDVTKDINGAGDYTFTLVPLLDGNMSPRNFRLVINGKEVAKSNVTDPEQVTRSVQFAVPATKPGDKVEVWLSNQSNDHWMGTSGSFEMKKKGE